MILLPKVKLAFVTVLVSIGFTSYVIPGLTQLISQSSPNPSPKPSPKPSPTTGQPEDKRSSGVTRGNCNLANNQTNKLLTALVPENVKGDTTAEYPVFWFYIPDSPENINSIEFSIHDKNDTKTFYRTSLKLPQTPGVIGISLPSKPQYALNLNQSYKWRLTMKCDSVPDHYPEVSGLVTRVQQNPDAWYDKLTNLGKRSLAEPQNPEVKQAWTELLKSVRLEELAQEPVVGLINDLEGLPVNPIP
jgi:hypothetical protein